MPASTSEPMAVPGFSCLARRFSVSPDMPFFMEASCSEEEASWFTFPMTSWISLASPGSSPSLARNSSEPLVLWNYDFKP